jgi:sugar/nucleoside kinase (ribokinase family)
MRKGGMALIDEARAQAIYDAMGPAVEMSGGSAANTIVGLASLGARAAFIGKRRPCAAAASFMRRTRPSSGHRLFNSPFRYPVTFVGA